MYDIFYLSYMLYCLRFTLWTPFCNKNQSNCNTVYVSVDSKSQLKHPQYQLYIFNILTQALILRINQSIDFTLHFICLNKTEETYIFYDIPQALPYKQGKIPVQKKKANIKTCVTDFEVSFVDLSIQYRTLYGTLQYMTDHRVAEGSYGRCVYPCLPFFFIGKTSWLVNPYKHKSLTKRIPVVRQTVYGRTHSLNLWFCDVISRYSTAGSSPGVHLSGSLPGTMSACRCTTKLWY